MNGRPLKGIPEFTPDVRHGTPRTEPVREPQNYIARAHDASVERDSFLGSVSIERKIEVQYPPTETPINVRKRALMVSLVQGEISTGWLGSVLLSGVGIFVMRKTHSSDSIG